MKKIYTITLDNEDYPSECLWDDVRIIASMVYDYIYNYIGDNCIPLDVNSDIIYNNIFYSRCSKFACYERSHYQLDSDIYDDGYINYEPFIVGRNTFGMTIVDDS